MDVKIAGIGQFDNINAQVDPMHRALRMNIRPPDAGFLGSYSQSFASGVMAAGLAAGSPVFSFRWSFTPFIVIIRKVRITAGTDSTAFAQGSVILDLIRATSFTVQDTGGATISLVGKSGVRATRMAASQIQIAASAIGNIAIAGTATLTAGTRTLDSNPLGVLVSSVGAVPANGVILPPGLLWDGSDPRKVDLELANNEGLVVRATVPATGTWKFGIDIDWDEVDPRAYFL